MAKWLQNLKQAVAGRRDPASRDYRYLALRIAKDLSLRERGLCIGLTAPEDEELTPEVVLMLAHSLRNELGSRVLMIDARVRASVEGLSDMLGMAGKTGFAEAMAQGPASLLDWVRPTAVDGVDVLPAGAVHGVVTVTSERLRDLLAASTLRYAYVLIAVGAVTADTRHLMLAGHCDHVVLVALEHRTQMRSLEDSQRLIQHGGGPGVHVVVVGRGG